MREQVLEMLKRDAYRKGEFTLSSGVKSNHYVNCKDTQECHPRDYMHKVDGANKCIKYRLHQDDDRAISVTCGDRSLNFQIVYADDNSS